MLMLLISSFGVAVSFNVLSYMTGEVSGECLIGYLPCTSENRKFRSENQMIRAILLGPLGRVQKIIYRL